MVGLGASTDRANGVSSDGSVAIGWSGGYSTPTAFRWTKMDGATSLDLLPSYNWSLPSDVSRDGSVVVGLTGLEDRFDEINEIFRWTEDEGMNGTGIFINLRERVPHVSDDGLVIAGSGYVSTLARTEAFYWTEDTGVVGLGYLPPANGSLAGVKSVPRDMTSDGRLIVGFNEEPTNTRSFVWTAAGGMEDFQQVLIDRHGLGDALAGWTLRNITRSFGEGTILCGRCNRPPHR